MLFYAHKKRKTRLKSLSIFKAAQKTFYPVKYIPSYVVVLGVVKGTFYSVSAGEIWNRHIKVPKIAPGLLFPVIDMNCCNKMLILTFFCVNKINLFNARTNMYWGYNQWFLKAL